VMAIRLAIALGGTPIGAPIAGWVADHWGPRWSLALAAAAGIAAALIGAYARQLRRVRTVDRTNTADGKAPAPTRTELQWQAPRDEAAASEV